MNKHIQELLTVNPYLKSEDVMKYLNAERRTVMNILHDERLKVIKLGNTYRVRLSDLNEYIDMYLYNTTNTNNNEAKNTKTRKRGRMA